MNLVYRDLAYLNGWMWTWALSLYVWNMQDQLYFCLSSIPDLSEHTMIKRLLSRQLGIRQCGVYFSNTHKVFRPNTYRDDFNPGWITLFILLVHLRTGAKYAKPFHVEDFVLSGVTMLLHRDIFEQLLEMF